MRKSIFMVMLGLLLVVPAFAAGTPNKAPTKELIVASDGEFTTITAALASITNASATNPYIIRVMPGIYNESITMKPYVDVVGSGRENTKITATTNAIFTVSGADNSTIENIWVDNSSPIQNGAEGTSAILNDNTSMTINNAKVTVASLPGGGPTNFFGILNRGASAKPVISNCLISAYGGGDSTTDLLGIGVRSGSDVTVQDCKIEIKAASVPNRNWQVGIGAYYSSQSAPGKLDVRDTVIVSEGGLWNRGIDLNYGGTMQATISNTKVTAIAASDGSSEDNYGVKGPYSGPFTITKSDISVSGTAAQGCAIRPQSNDSNKIGSSLIDGGICGYMPYKVVNSWDGDFNPIANQ